MKTKDVASPITVDGNFYRHALNELISTLRDAHRKFEESKSIYAEKIIDKKHYNHKNFIRHFHFDFAGLANTIQREISTKIAEIRKHKDKATVKNLEENFYENQAKKYGLRNKSGLDSLQSISFHHNEIISFFIRFDAWVEKWLDLPQDQRQYYKVNYNDMQSAKTMEMILFCLLSPSMMHMATDCKELHDSLIIMLNYMTHESTAKKELKILKTLVKNVNIIYSNKKIRHEFKISDYQEHISSSLKSSLSKSEIKTHSDVIEKYRLEKVVRRCKGKNFEEELPKYIQLCHRAKVYFSMIYDESQNATNKDSTMHKQIKKLLESFQLIADKETEAKKYVRREYWTATPAQHNGTDISKCYGVLGLNHTGIHCLENVYLKSINGLYMNDPKCANIRPNVISLDYIYSKTKKMIPTGFFIEKAYRCSNYFAAKRSVMIRNNLIRASIKTHSQYQEFVHENFAMILEYCAENNCKEAHDENLIDNNKSAIAIRVAKCNEVSKKLIEGISGYLTNPNDYHLTTFNSETKIRGRTNKHRKQFNLRKWIQSEFIKSEHVNKNLILFFTGMGRCGDRFPRDFRTFIEFSRGNDITVLMQGFFGRSCGYHKGRPWLLVHNDQKQIIENYIRSHGFAPPNSRQKGTHKKTNLTATFFIHEFPETKTVMRKFALALESTSKKSKLQGRNNTPYISSQLLDELIDIFVSKGLNLCKTSEKDYMFDIKTHKNPVHMQYDMKGNMVRIKNRSMRGNYDTGIGGATSSDMNVTGQSQNTLAGTFIPTIIWQDGKDGSGLTICGIKLLCRGSYIRNPKTNQPQQISTNLSNPNASAFPHIDSINKKPK